ncbi:monovalent cation/H+ antiporter subunit D family protein [Microbulbifer flavimaris]|uniref:Monovalent cation/H+ antiporter subunit D family protein n=1 Tax=Microbulbifer flavimaris TaxID=1781068 RepID=A0ABX4I3A4_9GAMM|nr:MULTISPECIES: monovalent cation/H+ antiporter subunit D family protein [Microbulbifer]KUJ84798.1 cation:proton antiporter [Microbulbifer sp. ZGT114]PCO06894.1 monovalent cation/H+ antiporter subunit D family protein [Microbulbifer flavimaris]
MLTHLPILQVILPLVAAPSCLFLQKSRLSWAFTLLVSLAAFVVSALLLQQVMSEGSIRYSLGGWDAPWGIEYRIDVLNAWVLFIVTGVSTAVIAAARASVESELGASRQTIFYTLYLLCFSGLLGIVATGDVFNVFVFLEISSLSTYALIAMGRDRRALWSAFQYLVLGTIGATFILIGIGFLYMMTGTLNMLDLAERLPAVESSTAVLAAFAFILVGICLKLALFPLHLWLPNAYSSAPSIVTAFLAATATKVALYLLVRFTVTVFGIDFSLSALPLQSLFILLGLAGVFVGSAVAIYQSNIKRMFAYSSVAQIGYMIVGIGISTVAGLQATLLHLFNHALMKAALFLALAGLVLRAGGCALEDFRGLGRRMPWTMGAIAVAGASLVGMPLTAGFISKWHLIAAAIDSGFWILALLIVAGSLLSAVYVWRLIDAAYLQGPDKSLPEQGRNEAPLGILIPTWGLVLANLYFGVETSLPVTVTQAASAYLLGGAP